MREFLKQKWNKKMLILSTFNSDYLQSPLESFLKKFNSERVNIQYTDTNLPIWLDKLISSEEKNQSVIILFRLIDLSDDTKKIDIKNIKENTSELIKQIFELKKVKKHAFIITLCPSPVYYDKYGSIKEIENLFLKEMDKNKIHSLSQSDINHQYALTDFENKIEYKTRIPYNFDFYMSLACLIARKLHCIDQIAYKVIIVDCDNTLWTGIAGDIGPENVKFEKHNLALQEFLVKQRKKGVFICLSSKNEEVTVSNVFSIREKDMILKNSDIKIKIINRDAKSNSIKKILGELKFINAKNAMFVDDSENEIDEVSQNFPEIFCVQMPQKMEEFKKIWAFDENEYASITQTDKDRLMLMAQEEGLQSYLSEFNNPIDRLKARRKLHPVAISKIEAEDTEDKDKIARIEQIPKRTNQFNLFPFSEYPEKEWNLENLIQKGEIDCFIATIKNLSSSGTKESHDADTVSEDLTALAVCKVNETDKHLLVNGFFVSCRNTGLEVEYELLKQIAIFAESKNLDKIKIKFKRTESNKLAETFVDILCQETNQSSLVRLLLRNTKKVLFLQSFLFTLFKKFGTLPIDLDKKLNHEIILNFSTRSLTQLDPYLLMCKTIEKNSVANNYFNKRVINKKDLENAKLYLPDLQKETSDIKELTKRFITGRQETNDLTEMVVEQLKFQIIGQNKSDAKLEIKLDDPLVFLGLSSLKLTYLSGFLYNELGVKIDIDRLLSPKMTLSALLAYINQQKDEKIACGKNFELTQFKQPCQELSLQEKRIFAAERSEGVTNSSKFHMIACFLANHLDINCFEIACQQLSKHYDVFNFSYKIVEGQVIKSILSTENKRINFYYEEIKSKFKLMDIIREKTSKPLSMLNSNELCTVLVFEAEKKFYITFIIHHCISDAFSLNLYLKTVSKSYNAALNSDYLALPKRLTYQNFVAYQQKTKINNEKFQNEAKKFWTEHLSICERSVGIPPDRTVNLNFKSITELKSERYLFEISRENSQTLKSIASQSGVTPYSVIISLFSILVAHYAHSEYIPIVTVTSGREALFVDTPGFFVNLLIHAFDLSKNKSFDEFFTENHKNLINGMKYQDFSFSEIQKLMPYNASKTVAIVFQSDEEPKLLLGNETAELIEPRPSILDLREECRFSPLTAYVQELQKKYVITLEVAKEKYSLGFRKSISENFKYLIKNFCKNPNQKIRDISVVCDDEREQLIRMGQGPKLDFSKKISLVSKFQQMVDQYPENIALNYDQKRLNYKEVDQQSTILAHVLIEAGVTQGNYVGIFLDATYLFFVAELAILKIGGVFIPLSKENPNERLKLIINDAKIKFFIVDDNSKGFFDTNLEDAQLISINSLKNPIFNLDKKLPTLEKNTDEFCILYTSGSTGTPKGVILREKGIFRVVESPNFIEVLPNERVAQTANQAFDAAQLECWLAWHHGASLVLFDKETILNINSFRNKLITENITHMWLTAGLFDSYANNQSGIFKNLRYLMVGGDVVHKDTVLKILNHPKAPIIINGYGPTEASIFALTHTFNKLNINNYNTTLIGSPINETTVEVLTPFGTQAPLGGIGELFVKGEGVAKGYLNSALDKNRFTGELGNRCYRTGDLVKYTTKDLQIMFMGRADDLQVKINGNLVALEEVRNCLSLHSAVKQVEVLFTNIGGANQLVAFYTLKSVNKKFIKSANEEFHEHLINRLPAYMFPSFYVQLDEFLVNAHGKLDKTQFLKFEAEFNKKQLEEIPPQTPNGKTLLKIIKKRLPSFPNNIKANFMNFGCDSISAMEIINTINNEFKLDPKKLLHANDLYRNPSIEGLEDELYKILNIRDKKGLLRILKNGDSNFPAIIFIHPAGGGLSCFYKLVGQLKFANICYGIEDPLLDRNQLKLLTMKEMARNYLSIILNEIQGPFILVGYSFGGMLALEMAAQNESTSENPQNLKFCGLIDTWVVSCISEFEQNDLKKEVLIYCKKQRQKANFSENSFKIMDQLETLCQHHQEIGFRYKPSKLTSTPVFLFKATILHDKFKEMHNQDKNNFLLNYIDENLFESTEIKATHFNILGNRENSLGEKLSNKINAYSREKCLRNSTKKLGDLVGQSFFNTPLNAINNDSTFFLALNQN